MSARTIKRALPLALAVLSAASAAQAQNKSEPPPLPPPAEPEPAPMPAPTTAAPPPEPATASPPPQTAPQMAPQPPPFVYEPAPAPMHAPHTSFWVGGQVGYIGYGGAFFVNGHNKEETSGNLVGSGLSLEVDAGARLNRRYLPYLLVEYSALTHGHRFDTDTRTASSLLGVGFRFVIGNVDRAGFLADLSLAQRTISIRRGGQQFQMHGPEIFRLGLGAEIRMSNLLTLSPIVHLSGGSMEQSDGSVLYVDPQGDGETTPTFQESNSISKSQRSYLVVGVGCGVHFDLFGK